MKVTCLTAFWLLQGSQAFVPQPSSTSTSSSSSRQSTILHERNQANGWFGPAAAAVAGLTLATQVAFASPVTMTRQPDAPLQTVDTPSILISAFGSGVETMDFSMPSYGEATKGDVAGSKEIPSFNPFGFGDSKDESSDTAVDDGKAAAEAKKADEKAAAEAKKAEEKAAAEAKKAEEKAAAEAKKAEKEARRLAELEKQKEAVERAKQKKVEEAASPAEEMETSAPEVSIPSFSAPEMPEVKLPEVKLPEMPKMSFPMPKLDLPDRPDMPKFEAPKVPEFNAPKIPEFNAPKIPEFSAPKMPSMSMPSFEAPKSSYDFDAPASPEEDIEPQEVRDARAKEARSVFLEADNEAKEIERQARALRDIANQKKKVAKELKDEACKTRFGGKFLCLRPLNSGY